jgi:prepilin-type processing-associated H-X9-DG protein
VACFSIDGPWVEPGAQQDVDNCHNDPAKNPSVASGKRALFNANLRRAIRDISDGTSNTVAVSEVIAGPDGSADLRGHWWLYFGASYTHLRLPNTPTPDTLIPPYCDPSRSPCDDTSPCASTVVVSARSYHSGGVNVTLADGSVRFVSDTIPLPTWQALASIRSGEIVPADY